MNFDSILAIGGRGWAGHENFAVASTPHQKAKRDFSKRQLPI
jgi:hypothetical protein